jgi:hypothetical protein
LEALATIGRLRSTAELRRDSDITVQQTDTDTPFLALVTEFSTHTAAVSAQKLFGTTCAFRNGC